MKADLYNIEAKKIDQIELPKEYFGAKVNSKLIAQAIKVYLSNQRTSYAKTKHRGEVAGTTKKMWSQKGTGRARHGSAKAPIFVGGGSGHGPRGNQNYTLKLSQKMRISALKSILSLFATNKSIIAVSGINKIEPKTKKAWNFVDLLEKDNQDLAKSHKIGIVTASSQENVKRAFKNIPDISLLSLKSLNVYNLANQDFLIFSQKALEKISK